MAQSQMTTTQPDTDDRPVMRWTAVPDGQGGTVLYAAWTNGGGSTVSPGAHAA